MPEAVAAVETVQAALTACDEAVGSALVDPCTAHITLAVLCLETPEHVERAVLALRRARCKHGLRNGTARRTFGLAGLGHFRHEVLFSVALWTPSHRSRVNSGNRFKKRV